MDHLAWTRDELLAEHAYARPHEATGYRLHGGFDADISDRGRCGGRANHCLRGGE